MPNIATNDPKGSQAQNALVWNGTRAVVSASPLAFASLANGQTFITITPAGAVGSRTINASLAASTTLATFCAALALELNTDGTTAFTWTATATTVVGTAKTPGSLFNSLPSGTCLTSATITSRGDDAITQVTPRRDIGIVFLGDSHTQGIMSALTLPLHDKATADWNTTAWSDYQRTVNWITDPDNNIDPNAASTGSLPSYSVLAAQYLRQCAQLDRVRSANVGFGGACTYTWGPVQARAYIQVATLPADGDTFTIGSQVYTYRTVAAAPYDILIGADIAAARLQTSRVISGEGADVVTGTLPHPLVYSPNPANTQYRSIFAVESGAAGNAITMSSAQASIVCLSAGLAPASTLGGGADGSTAFFTDNLTVNIPSAFGTVDYVVITLGTNDVARIGWRARGFAAEAAKIIALIRARWPLAKIIWVNPGATSLSDRNTLLETIVAPALTALETSGAIYTVDMYTATGSAAILSGDGVHYTDYGYGVLAQLVADKIIETL